MQPLPPPPPRALRRAVQLRVGGLLVLLALVVLAWRAGWLAAGAQQLPPLLEAARRSAWAGPVAAVVFALGSCLLLPFPLLVPALVTAVGPVAGGLGAWCGAALTATAGFAVGRVAGAGSVERLLGRRGGAAVAAAAERGVLSMAVLRNLPVAPFVVASVAAGTTSISFWRYLVGTQLGIIPTILALTVLGQGLVELLRGAGRTGIILLAAGALLVAAVAVVLARGFSGRQAPSEHDR